MALLANSGEVSNSRKGNSRHSASSTCGEKTARSLLERLVSSRDQFGLLLVDQVRSWNADKHNKEMESSRRVRPMQIGLANNMEVDTDLKTIVSLSTYALSHTAVP